MPPKARAGYRQHSQHKGEIWGVVICEDFLEEVGLC